MTHNLRNPNPIINHQIGEPHLRTQAREQHNAGIDVDLAIRPEQAPIVVIVPGEEVVVEGPDPGEVEEGPATVVAAEGGRGRGFGGAEAVVVVPGEVEAGEEGFERRVAVDEGGDEVGPVLDDRTEREDEEREEEEGGEVGGEGGAGLLQQLSRRPEIAQPRMMMMMVIVVVAHGGT
ncbi:hypothetical protein TorRG33x02_024690 [Trema orientale]|uniref:Uncharacterized protein n=1 Tax=Trema orientale TaxID=63057 RepID=A0A2P5FV77_TREOI|nr:hypothetical protein TorRG33x02_024690 [Trema orientale]